MAVMLSHSCFSSHINRLQISGLQSAWARKVSCGASSGSYHVIIWSVLGGKASLKLELKRQR